MNVVLMRDERQALAIVEDDGVGFDPEETATGRRLGLLGMRERLSLVGGTLDLESRPAARRPSMRASGPIGPGECSVMIKLKVCLADDQPVVRAGLRALLDARDDMEVVGEASDGRRAVDALLELRPDVSVLDLSMPEMGGAEAAAKIHAACPEVKVLALTVHEDEAYIRQMLAAGASGYVLKRGAAEELIQAVRAVSAGGIYLDPSLSGKVAGLVRRPVGPARPAAVELSAREAESFRLISRASRIKKSPRSSSGTPRRSRRTRPGRWKSSGCLAGLRSSSMPSAAVG